MNKAELIEAMAEQTELTKKDVEEINVHIEGVGK